MANGTFSPNSAGFKEMAIGSEITVAVNEIASKAREAAEDLSADFVVTGDYIESFNVRAAIVELQTTFGSHPVAAGILENTSDHAAAVEWGNRHDHRPHRVLGRVLDGLSRD